MNLKIFTDNIEEKAKEQVLTLASQPAFSDCRIRIMPDVHAGAGCVIGFTADLGNKVIPQVVGVDIGCGMLTCVLGDVPINFEQLDEIIYNHIPHGLCVHNHPTIGVDFLRKLRCLDYLKNRDRIRASLGTLGGGNHFIEIDQNKDGDKYLIIHTGSRNLGKQVADYYQNIAIDKLLHNKDRYREAMDAMIADLKERGLQSEISNRIKELRQQFDSEPAIPRDLCYLTDQDREDYLHDMALCQWFATQNRQRIAFEILCHLCLPCHDYFETIHNYIDLKSNIVRKGAIAAYANQRLLIPMNMRDGCILGIGKGNPDWNCSAPHGAGRIMSRMQAKETISMDDYRDTMREANIFTTSVNEQTIDESPMAYKPMDEIVRLIEPTVEIVDILKPIYNFKAAE